MQIREVISFPRERAKLVQLETEARTRPGNGSPFSSAASLNCGRHGETVFSRQALFQVLHGLNNASWAVVLRVLLRSPIAPSSAFRTDVQPSCFSRCTRSFDLPLPRETYWRSTARIVVRCYSSRFEGTLSSTLFDCDGFLLGEFTCDATREF